MWIDGIGSERIGDVGFLINTSSRARGGDTDSYYLSDSPARTKQSHEPRLWGWCGSTNNVSTTARGIVRVTRLGLNARGVPSDGPLRVYVEAVEGEDGAAFLESAGYPDLK